MILLNKLTLEGFGIYAKQIEIEFREGVTPILGINDSWERGRSNGSGKTTILNAICWALFGRTPEGASKDDVVHYGLKGCRVELNIGNLNIVRSKTRTKGERLEIYYEGMYMDSKVSESRKTRLRDNQKKIEEYLGLDFYTFCNAIYIGQTNKTIKFLEAEPAERTKVLQNLVVTDVYERAITLMKSDLAKFETELAREVVLMGVCEERDEELGEKLADLKHQWKMASKLDKDKKRELKAELRMLRNDYAEQRAILKHTSKFDMEELNIQLTKAKKNRMKAYEQYVLANKKLGENQLLTPGKDCPLCFRKITSKTVEHVEDIIDGYEASKLEYRDRVHNLDLEIKDIEHNMELCRAERSAKVTAKERIKQIKRERTLLKDQEHFSEAEHIRSSLAETTDAYEQNKVVMARKEDVLKNLQRKIRYVKDLAVIMGPEARNFIFDSIRTKLAMYCREHLATLTDGVFKVKFPYRTKLGKEKFEIEVYREGVEQKICNLSYGERWRVSFALMLAFRNILMENVKTRFGFLLVDDSLGGLDPEGKEDFYRAMLEGKHTDIPQVILTVPEDGHVRHMDNKILVRRGAVADVTCS